MIPSQVDDLCVAVFAWSPLLGGTRRAATSRSAEKLKCGLDFANLVGGAECPHPAAQRSVSRQAAGSVPLDDQEQVLRFRVENI